MTKNLSIVILTVYPNKYLEKAIESALTNDGTEILVSVNGNTNYCSSQWLSEKIK